MNRKFKLISAIGLFITFSGFAQSVQQEVPSNNWFNEDAKEQKVNGVSSDEAYQYLKGKKSETVIG